MQLSVTGKQVEVGDALRGHVEARLGSVLEKYFKTAIEAHVVVSREAHLSRAEITLHIGRGIAVNAHASASDFFTAFDGAAERAAKRLRRHKRRLRDHHAKAHEPDEAHEPESEPMPAAAASGEALPSGDAPAVIAEISVDPPHLTVGEAATQMDLAGAPVLLFRNRSHGELNLVYRRADGHIGWVDPELDRARRQRE